MNYLAFLEKGIRFVIMATADDRGLPVTCAADITGSGDDRLYFSHRHKAIIKEG